VYAQDQVAWYYYTYTDGKARLYFEVPSTWIEDKATDKDIWWTGDGASIQLFGNTPEPGTVFPSSNTQLDQIVNNWINSDVDIDLRLLNHAPDMRLLNHAPFSINGMGAYWLSYIDDSKGEQKTMDRVLLLSDGILYRAEFTVPASLYEETKSIRDGILTSIRVGDGYDNKMAELNEIAAIDAQMQEIQAQKDKLWAEHDKFIADAHQNMWDGVINNLQEGTEADANRREDLKKYYDECDRGLRPLC
jgi:hypothetical protein